MKQNTFVSLETHEKLENPRGRGAKRHFRSRTLGGDHENTEEINSLGVESITKQTLTVNHTDTNELKVLSCMWENQGKGEHVVSGRDGKMARQGKTGRQATPERPHA